MKGSGMGACTVRKDGSLLLECGHSGFEAARMLLADFCELVKSLPAYHTYRITHLSLWNAAASGRTAEDILQNLALLSSSGVPAGLEEEIRLLVSRYGRLQLHTDSADPSLLILRADNPGLMDELAEQNCLSGVGLIRTAPLEYRCPSEQRGLLKQELTRMGYPVLDYAGYRDGQALDVPWKESAPSGTASVKDVFGLRDYQEAAVRRFKEMGASGVVVLPCGAGKTIVGLAVLASLQCETLILTSSATSVAQWRDELLERTGLNEESVGEYSGVKREVLPVTVATYQMLTHRRSRGGAFVHMNLFTQRNWGLIIYDEVHLLPAPVFRATADIQATRRLGLTATLVREDGRESDVFSLIGPKCYELPWKVLEKQGWIASVDCIEVVVPMLAEIRLKYLYAGEKEKFRIAACNPAKIAAVTRIVNAHPDEAVLVIGQYLDQLNQLAASLGAPLITGKTPQRQRSELYSAFRDGKIRILVVSKVANFAVNLPDASVGIEVSGAYGSRQEEAQRLGRILRPKSGENKAYFYTLVSGESREQDFALRRRRFLTEQGYDYAVQTEQQEEIIL
ncbi:DNA repair helicase XPB [Paenibacillus sp. sgz5001063]|uniref:DNA repair helicase XPB n=1 Tax=Paenibacillus sp. sgz5001063 TaxID=3242474 RepID=UPI0036D29116